MCLLILQQKDAKIKDDSLKNAFDYNPDGVGYSFISINQMVTKKYRKYDKFLKAYKTDVSMYGSKSPFLLHFRMTTHGTNKGTFNVHPFKVRDGLMFAHNGIINDVDTDKKLSDTQVFNREYLQNLDRKFLKDDTIVNLLESFIGTSKLAFLDVKGTYKILNESLGHWKDKVWYSNNSYEDRSYGYSYGYGQFWKSADQYDDYSIYKSVDKEDANPYKNSKTPTLQCDYCDDRVCSLTHYDISDKHEDQEPKFIWLCDVCLEYEEELDLEETERYNDSFKSTLQLPVGRA